MSDNDRTTNNPKFGEQTTSVAATAAGAGPTTREGVVAREKEQFGGMKFGSAFFGWLTSGGTHTSRGAAASFANPIRTVDGSMRSWLLATVMNFAFNST